MAFDDCGFDPMFLDEFHRRHEEVEQESPLGGVEVVHQGNDPGVLEALVAKVLSHDGPILPLDMGIVVFVVLTRSCVLHRPSTVGEVFEQGPIDKLRAIITIESLDGNGRAFSMLMRASMI